MRLECLARLVVTHQHHDLPEVVVLAGFAEGEGHAGAALGRVAGVGQAAESELLHLARGRGGEILGRGQQHVAGNLEAGQPPPAQQQQRIGVDLGARLGDHPQAADLPHRSSGTPTAYAWLTPGWAVISSSISLGITSSPPLL